MTNHTPGPWRVEHRTVWSSEFRICQLDAGGRTNKGDIAQANAQLIAAAPEMLECIQEALRQLNTLDFSLSTNWNASVKENAIQLLEHAINKAEGRN